jgi:hypothetical protein
MPRKITPATSLENLKKQAKRWLKELRANHPDARARFERASPNAPVTPVLRDVQYALAREYGHESWLALKKALQDLTAESGVTLTQLHPAEAYERLAQDWVLAYDSQDQAALRGLGVSCKNVEDEALATLPRFPVLRELTPIGMKDDGFRHVGQCERLERLTCMYCRETTDAATEHIAAVQLKYYYAGLTLITDRSLEILGGMPSLEQVELYECKGVTDDGLVFLTELPRLREVHLDGLPRVTLEGTRFFPGRVRVKYST